MYVRINAKFLIIKGTNPLRVIIKIVRIAYADPNQTPNTEEY